MIGFCQSEEQALTLFPELFLAKTGPQMEYLNGLLPARKPIHQQLVALFGMFLLDLMEQYVKTQH